MINNYKIAILLLSSKEFEQLDWFLDQFKNDNRFQIYIHRDIKTKFTESQEEYLRNKFTNIKEIISEIDVRRCKMSMVYAEERLLRISQSDENLYYCLISEETMITKSLDEIYELLSPNNETSIYLDFCHRDDISNKRFFREMAGDKYLNWIGTQWFTFRKDAVDLVLEKMDDKQYVQWLIDNQGYHCADESFFQNMIKTSKEFDGMKIKKPLTFVCWYKGFSHYGNNKRPIYLDIGFIKMYEEFGLNDCIFARKINVVRFRESKIFVKMIESIKNNRYHK